MKAQLETFDESADDFGNRADLGKLRLLPLGRRRKFCRGAKEAAVLSLAPRLLGLSGAEVLAKTRLFAFQGHL